MYVSAGQFPLFSQEWARRQKISNFYWKFKHFIFTKSVPDRPFHSFGASNSFHDIFRLHDLEVLKLKGSVGSGRKRLKIPHLKDPTSTYKSKLTRYRRFVNPSISRLFSCQMLCEKWRPEHFTHGKCLEGHVIVASATKKSTEQSYKKNCE